jgi:putative nucleotidyltransferase-like protein
MGHMLERRGENRVAMSFQQNVKLLSLLLKGNHGAATELLQDGAVRPDDFIRFVEEHWLQLIVCSLLHGSPARKLLPSKWLVELTSQSLHQWAGQERLVRELFRLSTLLKAAGHEFILLKGPYLAERFFGGVDRRPFSDLDILIRREDIAALERLLCANGFVANSSSLLGRRLTTYFTYSFDFVKPDVAVDLHWRISAQPAHQLDYQAIWKQKQVFSLRTHRFWVLPDEYEIVFNLISIFKDLEMGIARLRSFVDLHFILRRLSDQLDWEAFREHRKREKLLRISLSMLDLFFELFDCRDEFPKAATMVAREERRIKVIPVKHYRDLMEAVPGAARNKIWASDLYECSRFSLFLWWVVGLPFRIAVYHPDKYSRMKRRLSWLGLRGPKSDAPVEPAEIRRATQ